MNEELTIAEIFPVSEENIQEQKWNSFKNKLETEIKNIRWSSALPDLSKKIGELFNIKLPDIFISAWTKAGSIKKAMEETKQLPDKIVYVELAEHTIKSEHHPYIEIKIGGVPQPKKINFLLQLSINLKGFILKIKDGLIYEIQTGSCEIAGSLKCEDILIKEKKCEEIKLPGVIKII